MPEPADGDITVTVTTYVRGATGKDACTNRGSFSRDGDKREMEM